MMKQIVVVFIFLNVFSCNGQPKTGVSNNKITEIVGRSTALSPLKISQLDSLNVGFQLIGNCYAASSKKNNKPSNGEARCDNFPQKVDEHYPRQGLYLVINQKEFSVFDSTILGCQLYVVNTTDSVVEFQASDSRLYIVAEALNDNNEWMPISYLPSSWCGNSYHTVILDKNEYWNFVIPIFKGVFKTKLRYTLSMSKGESISSNEITTYINREQFDKQKKQGYGNNNIMNPYRD